MKIDSMDDARTACLYLQGRPAERTRPGGAHDPAAYRLAPALVSQESSGWDHETQDRRRSHADVHVEARPPQAFTNNFTVILVISCFEGVMDGVGSPSMNALQADVLPAAENFARDANFLNVPGDLISALCPLFTGHMLGVFQVGPLR
jgi:hypothetical protein